MKKFNILFLLSCMLVFLGCSGSGDDNNDPTPSNPKIDNGFFQGQWYCEKNSRFYNFGYSTTLEGYLYEDMKGLTGVNDYFAGSWVLFPENSILRTNVTYTVALTSGSEDYSITSIDDYTMVLRSMELNVDYTYHKVVETYNGKIGDQFDIDYTSKNPAFSSSTFSSINSAVAQVDNSGHVKLVGSGDTFIFITSTAGSVWVKVRVGSRVDFYTNELMNNTIDQILEKYGTPDGSVNQDGQTSYAYMITKLISNGNVGHIVDARLSYIDYIYDATTREIIEMRTVYFDEACCQADWKYITEHNYQLSAENSYGPDPFAGNCNYYYINRGPVDLRGNVYYYISYLNFAYKIKHQNDKKSADVLKDLLDKPLGIVNLDLNTTSYSTLYGILSKSYSIYKEETDEQKYMSVGVFDNEDCKEISYCGLSFDSFMFAEYPSGVFSTAFGYVFTIDKSKASDPYTYLDQIVSDLKTLGVDISYEKKDGESVVMASGGAIAEDKYYFIELDSYYDVWAFGIYIYNIRP